MIKGANIYKTFAGVRVLKGIDIAVQSREIVSITGESGAGKTTLLQILGTLAKPDREPEAEILIDNSKLSALNDRKLSRFRNRNIGFVFQFHRLLPEFNAWENIALPALIAGDSRSDARKKTRELLRFLKLEDRSQHKPNQLSGGEQQRVAVARALINRPKAVLADEPSGNLDSRRAAELHQLFFDLRIEFDQTFVIVTHNKELAEMADRRLEMADGLMRDVSCVSSA